MRKVTLRFIKGLRAAGVRISLSESLDALHAVAAAGIERDVLREALAATLIKEEEDRPLFEEVFARFFAGPKPQRKDKQPGSLESESQKVHSRRGEGQQAERPKSDKPETPQLTRQPDNQSDSQQKSTNRQIDKSEKRKANEDLDFQTFRLLDSSKLARHKALLEKPFKAFDPRDVEAVKDVVAELSRRLHGRLSRRYKPRKRGRLDFRRTIRASIPRGGTPIELLLRGRRPGKPDLVAFCDLSGSVALVSDFLLALLAPAAPYFRRVHLFAYVDRVCEVSFERGHVVPHSELDLYARSDFGKVLQQFWQEYGASILTRNSVVLVLGDARNNRRPPRPDLLARMRDHAQKLIWLNPEPRPRWNTGDSVISRYTPACDAVLECGNLRELLDGLGRTL
jgi:uncharacterized protein